MMLTLAWKEYREHRAIWLTMVVMTSLFAFAIIQLADSRIEALGRAGLMALGMAAAYGVVCGAMMFAGEREAGTFTFLDIFLGRRGLLWTCKLPVGIFLAVTEALAVALVLHFLLDLAPPAWMVSFLGRGRGVFHHGFRNLAVSPILWFIVLPMLTVEAYAWGLLGSAMTRRVLSGAALAALFALPFWLFAVFAPPPIFLVIRLVSAGMALILSSIVLLTQSKDAPLAPPPKRTDTPHPLRRVAERWEREKFDLERRAPRLARRDGKARDAALDLPIAMVVAEEELVRVEAVRERSWRPAEARGPAQVLWWLTLNQAWLLVLILSGLAAFVGVFVPAYGQVLWPMATLLLGVACGTAAFAHEQRDASYQFLAAQHFPLTSFWNVKILFWLGAAVLLALLAGVGALLAGAVRYADPGRPPTFADVFEFGTLRQLLGPVLFFSVWLVYGFCAGQVFVLLCRKNVLAVLLASMVAAGALIVWMPSLLCGGMSGWQVWLAPLVVLAATRVSLRAWAGGRIKERRPLLRLVGFAAIMLAWAGLVFLMRAWEIPSVDEPLDREAYKAAVPSGPDNLAGVKIHAALGFADPAAAAQGGKGVIALAPPGADQNVPAQPGPMPGQMPGQMPGPPPDPPQGGQPKVLGPEELEAQWLALLAEAEKLPLGVLELPRRDGQPAGLRHVRGCFHMAERLRTLADQAWEKGKPDLALDRLGQILLLSRTLRHKAPVASYTAGVELEQLALDGWDGMLHRARTAPDAKVLRRAFDLLTRHAAQTPSALDCLETECYRAGAAVDNPTLWTFYDAAGSRIEPAHAAPGAANRDLAGAVPERWLAGGIALALDMPWEDERKTRLWIAVWAGYFRNIRTPLHTLAKPSPLDTGSPTTKRILRGWLPATEGPGSSLSAERLARLLDASWVSDPRLFAPLPPLRAAAARSECDVHMARLALALNLHQLEENKQAGNLEALVPKYLAELPVDPYSGVGFRFRISHGERIVSRDGRRGEVRPGQAILWSTGPDGVDNGGRRDGGRVDDDEPAWGRDQLDLVTVVPTWPRD